MIKSGKVLNFDDDKVYLMTEDKEFITVKRTNETPVKDETYSGEEITPPSKLVLFLSILIIVSITGIYLVKFLFFRADASIVVSFNSNIKIGINNNKIVDIASIGGDSLDLVAESSVKGNEINEGLIILFDEALKENLLDTYTGYDRGKVNVYITKAGHKEPLNFTKFIDYAYEHNYDIVVNKNDNRISLVPN
ncbi:hypothetical protein [Clostridium sp. UBA4548]|uniref:hypothetical protein n=1 Tax=Clostridium sp. UBA4548 TaxID=1946361 RepID=UPI0025C0C1B7|nr:hypothetical protein [Clostridium sp. UBA4548]